MLRRLASFFGLPQKININLDELDQLSEEQRHIFGYFLQNAKQKASKVDDGGDKEEIFYANQAYPVTFLMRNGSERQYLLELNADLICYPRKKDASDRRFAVLGQRIGWGTFGSVYESAQSLSVTTNADLIHVKSKLKSEGKKRVIKRQAFFAMNQGDELLAVSECKFTKMAAPELHVKSLSWHTLKKQTAMLMHYQTGEDLYTILANDQLKNNADRLDICLAIAENLAKIHENGIIHRDLKPENIKVRRGVDGRYQVSILDFGLATEIKNPDDNGCGSPDYAAPEMFVSTVMIRGQGGLTVALDVYSLVRVFEAVFGYQPSWDSNQRQAVKDNFTKPFNSKFTKYEDCNTRSILNAHGLQALFQGMRLVDPKARMSLSDVIANLKRMRDEISRVEAPIYSAANAPTLFTPQIASAAAAAVIHPDVTFDEYGYDENEFCRNCS